MKTKFKKLTKLVTLLMVLTVIMFSNNTTAFAAKLLPVGGSEWSYNPSGWNDTAQCRSNCYQYAVLKTCSSVDKFKVQPGYSSGQTFTKLSESNIIAAVKRDLKGSGFDSGRKIYKTTASAVPPKGYRKVALVIAPNMDYHWYEQNSNGYWSHKPGLSAVTNLDASGNKITNPKTCDRSYVHVYTNNSGTYAVELNYSTFCGFYMVN